MARFALISSQIMNGMSKAIQGSNHKLYIQENTNLNDEKFPTISTSKILKENKELSSVAFYSLKKSKELFISDATLEYYVNI